MNTINARIAVAIDEHGEIAASRYKSPHGDTVHDCLQYFAASDYSRLTGEIAYYVVECMLPRTTHQTITASATLQPNKKS